MVFVSDWAILNDTKSKQLERILAEFYHLSQAEIDRACILLESYHAVYRRDRLARRRHQLASGQARIKDSCLPPTPNQMDEIALRVNAKATIGLQPEEVITQLQELAGRLQQYRLDVRKRLKATASSDRSNHRLICDRIHSDDCPNNGCVPFLHLYA